MSLVEKNGRGSRPNLFDMAVCPADGRCSTVGLNLGLQLGQEHVCYLLGDGGNLPLATQVLRNQLLLDNSASAGHAVPPAGKEHWNRG